MAASGSVVTVLTPNGRRQTVKVTPNTPLLQVLEEVCRNHGFDPNEHGLKFQRNILDLSLPWRFANLPNNAKLEMVASARKQHADSQVRIALQMEDGSRLQDSFSSGQSLWELITHFPQISGLELAESGANPTCVYMRDEICGADELKKTTLKSLGLTGGSAIIRFLLKKERATCEEYEASAIPFKLIAKETIPISSPQPDCVSSLSHKSTTTVPVQNSNVHQPIETPPVSTTTADLTTIPAQQEDVKESQDAFQPESSPKGCQTPVQDEEKAGPSNSNNQASTSSSTPFIPFSGGGQRLGSEGGFTPPLYLSPLNAIAESPKAKKAKSSLSSSTKNKVTASSQEDDTNYEEYLEPVEREPLIYHLDSMPNHTENHDDLPDEFFEVTVDDVRKRFAQLKSERKSLEEAPLMTKTLRDAQMREKMERYPKVVLRVQFPDRHILQGFFRPFETVGVVRHFVKNYLEDPQLCFYLFITPPRTVLDDSSATLFQADLFPGALVHFGSESKTGSYIKRELLGNSVTALQANESIASSLLRLPEPSSSYVDSETPPAFTELRQDPPAPTRNAKPTSTSSSKVPKWLKLPGKK